MNILLVDDEKPFAGALAQRLRQRGFGADCAYSGPEALARLESGAPVDVVVLDLKMPGMDGIEAMERMKTAHPLVEIIMLTGFSGVETAVKAVKRGAFNYLEKPCPIDRLILMADQAFSRKKKREAALRDIQARPYISQKEREELEARVLES